MKTYVTRNEETPGGHVLRARPAAKASARRPVESSLAAASPNAK